jgi:Ca-activated chloride channel homolog
VSLRSPKLLAAIAVAVLAVAVALLASFQPWGLTFKSPLLLLCLLAVPVAVAAYLELEHRRAKRAAQWSSPALLVNMVGDGLAGRRAVPAALFLTALTLLLVGFARPEAKFSEAKDGATIVLMVDTSGSMAANDVKPTRLAAADAALAQFVDKLPSKYRVALVTFSLHATIKVAPTYDRKELIAGLPTKTQLEGTALGDALVEAVNVAKKAVGPSKPGSPHPPATILLISDGGYNAGKATPAAAAKLALKAAIPVSAVSIGTLHGSVHQNVPLGKGTKTFPLVSAAPVDTGTLRTIAKGSGGKLYLARSSSELNQVYKDLGTRLVYSKQFREITVGLTAAALVLILLGAGLSAVWFRRLV